MFDYSILTEHAREPMRRYIKEHIRPGSFLQAVLADDFVRAEKLADKENKANLHKFFQFVYFEIPKRMWGSKEKVEIWIKNVNPI